VGIGLGQIGEFSFVLGLTAAAAGAIGDEVYAAILGAVVVTIIGSSVVVRLIGERPGDAPGDAPMTAPTGEQRAEGSSALG
jgi:Kef-type K+ transport system membrane component KefB